MISDAISLSRSCRILALAAVMAFSSSCGKKGDDDDSSSSLDTRLAQIFPILQSKAGAFADKVCSCIHEMQPSADCEENVGEIRSAADQFDPQQATECDRQVYAEFESEANQALDCVRTVFPAYFDGMMNMTCDQIFAGSEDPDAMDQRMEQCYPGWGELSNSFDQYVTSHHLENCVNLFAIGN